MSANPQVPLPSRESIIGYQVNTLLGIATGLIPYVLHLFREDSGGTPSGHPELDGGVSSAATVTLIAVCDRLTEIAKDNTRWGMEGQDKLEAALMAMYAANTELLNVSKLASQIHSSPVALFKPTLGRLPDGKFFAVYGDLNKPDGCVLGTGNTMEEALQDYNAQFKKTAQEANRIAPEVVVEAEVVPPPIPPNYTKSGKRRQKG